MSWELLRYCMYFRKCNELTELTQVHNERSERLWKFLTARVSHNVKTIQANASLLIQRYPQSFYNIIVGC